MDRLESIEKLAGLLSADEYGDAVSEMLVEILAEERMEQSVLDFMIATKQPLTAGEVSDAMGAAHPSLRHRTHASSVLNSLVSKGVLGKIKVGQSYYFTTPKEAVMECMKKRGEEPGRCPPVSIADETGVPLAAVLEVIGRLLSSE